MCKTYSAVMLATIYRLFSSPRFQKYSQDFLFKRITTLKVTLNFTFLYGAVLMVFSFFGSVDNLKRYDCYLLAHLSFRKTTVSVNTLEKQDFHKGKHSQAVTFVQINFSLYPKICSEICLGVKKLKVARNQKIVLVNL